VREECVTLGVSFGDECITLGASFGLG
jgi:hypothetical protein